MLFKLDGNVIIPVMANVQDEPLRYGCTDNWCWNRRDKSHEVRLYGPKLRTAHFHPNWSNGTAGVRGTRILNRGRYYWEVKVSQRIFGTSMMFGIGTKKARLHVDAFVNMLGEDGQGWGLSHKGLLWHNGEWRQYTKPFRENEATTVGILFDGRQGTLTYYKDGTCLGVAFTGLHLIQEELYPIVCSTAAKTEMSLGQMKREYTDLQDRCRSAVMSCLRNDNDVIQLKLPNRIKAYLLEATDSSTGHDRPRRNLVTQQAFHARIAYAAKNLNGVKGSCLYV
ncbi:SPRY domain-containing SOCS box protein 3-like isoform X1 [Centruroides sculpturatus]|uniref:SPRY domain-containing SOCS box protein 3-like isoform X1 n=1 Tax=Centruroides sculpturatus TaxID=218467 RepID=UPI000C6ECD36|nr:SPRY domain-containing SOCS box protein 3-like isoform X1 [Centruroides sculpturatus]